MFGRLAGVLAAVSGCPVAVWAVMKCLAGAGAVFAAGSGQGRSRWTERFGFVGGRSGGRGWGETAGGVVGTHDGWCYLNDAVRAGRTSLTVVARTLTARMCG